MDKKICSTYSVVLYLLQDSFNDFTRVLEGSKDFLRIIKPVGVDLQHGMEVTHIVQMFLEFSLNKTKHNNIILQESG